MAITINVRYTGTGGQARAFAWEMASSGTVSMIREEPGNLRYEYYVSLEDPETVLLVDSWTGQDALDAHHASPVMERIARLRDQYDLHMSVERFEGLAGNPADEGFIRR
ncbi:putative quinol monooxygenase [Bifidobacterium pseudolongum]|uniref:putative quinol monooxygenase n=1 Tax=Bifidobacterium pseudolongum TaxID=1694 RepID=UPI0010223E60|nr:putative quinol monooxygenase [Bifidobacterium pseudolongum]RYQ67107.1 monooxygenase [Bifidobacterium pseudolongum subsp. globosum]